MRIYACQINHLTNPLGYQMEHTVFSWKVEDSTGKQQRDTRLQVALRPDMTDVVYDTGKADLDSIATTLCLPLKPRTRYYWTVEVTDDNGECAVSEVNWFETAKREEPWKARWITCQTKQRHPIFSRKIQVQKSLESARLYISGLGVYEARINGEKVGDEYLAPYCNNYHQWIQYQTYDVTEALRGGGMLSVTVGNGWYAGRMGYFSKPGDPGLYGSGAKLIAEMVLRYADGTEEVVCTDESWSVTRSCIVDSSIYDGEFRDDTLPETQPEAVIETQVEAPLVERYSLPVRVQETVKPIELIHTHYAQPLTVEYVSSLNGYSRSTFCKIFRRITGDTFHNTLNRHRVENARRLLSETRASIETVAHQVGFRDAKSFCRVFKSLSGQSPGSYRKSTTTK